MKKKFKKYHTTNETVTRLQCLDLKKITELKIAHTDESSNYIFAEYPDKVETLYNYMLKNQSLIIDYVEFQKNPEFITNNHDFFMNCVRYCNTFDPKYLK